jgi:hypothetical protein
MSGYFPDSRRGSPTNHRCLGFAISQSLRNSSIMSLNHSPNLVLVYGEDDAISNSGSRWARKVGSRSKKAGSAKATIKPKKPPGEYDEMLIDSRGVFSRSLRQDLHPRHAQLDLGIPPNRVLKIWLRRNVGVSRKAYPLRNAGVRRESGAGPL